ncbi:hypothetical protein F4679DRAFT_583883 [Xylaria curta]|nr:hypothetical protein F4679DRAFT_583883 [Xylaria curta]
MDPRQTMQYPVVYFVPQSTGILPPLRGFPQQPGQPSSNPLWLLSQAAQPNDPSTHHHQEQQYHHGDPPPSETSWLSEGETAHEDDTSSSDEHEHDFMLCLQNHLREVLDWYQSSMAAAEDVQGLARQIHRFIRAACKHYAQQGTVPAIRDVQMTSSTFPFHARSSARVEELERPETPPSQPAEMDAVTGSLTFTDEDVVGVQDTEDTESSAEEMSTVASQGTSYSCPCEGLPSRHHLWAQQASSSQHGGFF